jgi:hypothetical protein
MVKQCRTDPNYPMWGNTDQHVKLVGVIRITTAEMTETYFPHLIALFFTVIEY